MGLQAMYHSGSSWEFANQRCVQVHGSLQECEFLENTASYRQNSELRSSDQCNSLRVTHTTTTSTGLMEIENSQHSVRDSNQRHAEFLKAADLERNAASLVFRMFKHDQHVPHGLQLHMCNDLLQTLS